MINIHHLTSSFFRFFFRWFYHCQVYGVDQPYQGAAIIAPNHISYFDPPLIAAAWPEDTYFLARSSLFRSKWSNWLLSRLHAYPVKGSEQNIDTFRLICQLLKEGKKVVIFPEGKRSGTGQLQELKTGVAMLALRMNCPIIPTYISGTYEAWPRQQRWPRLNAKVSCTFGQPIFPSQFYENKKVAQDELNSQVQQKLDALRSWYEEGAQGAPP